MIAFQLSIKNRNICKYMQPLLLSYKHLPEGNEKGKRTIMNLPTTLSIVLISIMIIQPIKSILYSQQNSMYESYKIDVSVISKNCSIKTRLPDLNSTGLHLECAMHCGSKQFIAFLIFKDEGSCYCLEETCIPRKKQVKNNDERIADLFILKATVFPEEKNMYSSKTASTPAPTTQPTPQTPSTTVPTTQPTTTKPATSTEDAVKWTKATNNPLCYFDRSGSQDQFQPFYLPLAGTVNKIKLIHISGMIGRDYNGKYSIFLICI